MELARGVRVGAGVLAWVRPRGGSDRRTGHNDHRTTGANDRASGRDQTQTGDDRASGSDQASGGPPPPDQVALDAQRLQSFYPGNRKEAAYNLGRLGDPRAVPSLINALKHDLFHDVRVAAAIALGEIGRSEAAIALERCSIY